MELRIRIQLPKALEYLKDLQEVKIDKRSVLGIFLSWLLEELFLGVDREKALGFIMENARKKAFYDAELQREVRDMVQSLFEMKAHLNPPNSPNSPFQGENNPPNPPWKGGNLRGESSTPNFQYKREKVSPPKTGQNNEVGLQGSIDEPNSIEVDSEVENTLPNLDDLSW